MTPATIFACRLVLAALALLVTLCRRDARPVAVALGALALLDGLRLLHLPPRADLALWLAWPGVSAALSWRAWRPSTGSPCACGQWPGPAFAAAASAFAWAPWSWAAHPLAYAIVLKAPYVVSAAFSGAAWVARQKGEGPEDGSSGPLVDAGVDGADLDQPEVPLRSADRTTGIQKDEGPDDHSPSPSRRADLFFLERVERPEVPLRSDEATPAPRLLQACAAVLAWSGVVDLLVGALAPGAPYARGWPLSAATWVVLAWVLVRAARTRDKRRA